jgi:hypothetical protein
MGVDGNLTGRSPVRIFRSRLPRRYAAAADFLIATINFLWPSLIYLRQKFYLFDEMSDPS